MDSLTGAFGYFRDGLFIVEGSAVLFGSLGGVAGIDALALVFLFFSVVGELGLLDNLLPLIASSAACRFAICPSR